MSVVTVLTTLVVILGGFQFWCFIWWGWGLSSCQYSAFHDFGDYLVKLWKRKDPRRLWRSIEEAMGKRGLYLFHNTIITELLFIQFFIYFSLWTVCLFDRGMIPTELKDSVFITLPKKPKAMICTEFRTISLMGPATKLFLKIIQQRMANKTDKEVSRLQTTYIHPKYDIYSASNQWTKKMTF